MHSRRLARVLALLALLPAAPVATGGEAPLDGTPLAPLATFIGNWEIDDAWADGTPIWSRNEFRVGLGGQFVEIRTFTRDGNGPAYERYYTIFAWDRHNDRLTSYGFTYDGTVTVIDDVRMEGDASDVRVTSEWADGESTVRQEITILSPDEYGWKVWFGTDGEWQPVMDGVWKRHD